MGAGVAASPHCPFAGDTRPGRRGSPRWAVSRFEPEPGARAPILRSPSGACAPSGFPAGSPSGPKPWRFAAWQFRNRGPGSCCPAKPPPKHRFRVPAGLPLAEAAGLPGSPWTCVLGPPASQLPGRNPVLPEGSGPKPFLRRWQRADLRPAFCRTGTWTEVRRPACFGSVPEGPGTWALDDACRFRIR